MMRHQLLLAAVVSLGLMGCTVRPGSFVSLPTSSGGAPVGAEVPPAAMPDQAQAPVSEYGTLQLTIRWPERPTGYQTSLIPSSTNALTIKVASGSTVVGSTSVSRNEGEATATATMSLKAADNLSVEVLAYREADPIPNSASPIAQGTANVNITRSKKTSATIVLNPLIVPTITAVSRNSGVSGDEVTLTGTNFGSGSIPVAVYFNGYLTVGVTRSSETSLTVKVPPGAPTGKVVVKADGVSSVSNFTFWVPQTVGIEAPKDDWDHTNSTSRIVLLGKTKQFTAATTWQPKFGETVDQYGTPPAPAWSSSDPSAGTVDASGLFTAANGYVAAGTDVTASYGSYTSAALKAIPQDVTTTMTSAPASIGRKYALTTTFAAVNTFSDGATNSLIDYSSSNAASVSIDATTGLAEAVDLKTNGSVTISAASRVDSQKAVAANLSLDNGTLVASNVSVDTTWTLGNSPYVLTKKIQLGANATLSIDQGVVIYGDGNALEVYGTLDAIGTSAAKISLNGVAVIAFGSAAKPSLINLSFANINGGSLYTPVNGGSSYGSINLRDSSVSDVSYMYLWYPQADCYIERNIFLRSGGLSLGTNGPDIHIYNNVFKDQTTSSAVEVWATYDPGAVLLTNNSFLTTNKIAVMLPSGYNSASLYAANNYWGTTDSAVIDQMIYDQNDDGGSGAVIPYAPFLTAPHPNTPVIP